MNHYKVAQIGCGNRGRIHLSGWVANQDRCELAGVCDMDSAKMEAALGNLGIKPGCFTDAEKMMETVRPDILCFSTPPDIRLPFVELAVRHRVKGLVFEKPMALALAEARQITRLCNEHGIKAAVSFQHKYLSSFRKLKGVLGRQGIGKIVRIEASCQNNLTLLGSHYIDYALWANGYDQAQWVVGHVHGRDLLQGGHPSPNYALMRIGFANGVFATIECGRLSALYRGTRGSYTDNRLTVYGTHGYAWCDTDGGWGLFAPETSGEMLCGQGAPWMQQEPGLQPLFARDLLDWLDDDAKRHPCDVNYAYAGYEVMEAGCLSALDRRRVDLPFTPSEAGEDAFDRMRRELIDCPERF